MQLQTDQLHGSSKLGDNRNRESSSVKKKNLTCNIHFFKLFFFYDIGQHRIKFRLKILTYIQSQFPWCPSII